MPKDGQDKPSKYRCDQTETLVSQGMATTHFAEKKEKCRFRGSIVISIAPASEFSPI
jgi:hypothetical protein